MKSSKNRGTSFESFLREEGISEEIDRLARRRVRAWLKASGRPASADKNRHTRKSPSGRAR